MSAADRSLDVLFCRQRGLITHQQVLAAGGTARMIDVRVVSGAWRRVTRGVYALAAAPTTWEQRCEAAQLAHPTGVLGGATAAVLMGLDGFGRGPVEVTLPPAAAHHRSLAVVRRSTLLRPTVVDGWRLNAAAFVLVELSGRLGARRLDRAIEEAVLGGRTSFDELRHVVADLRRSRRPGLGRLQAILDERGDDDAPAESMLEAALWAALDHPDVPPVRRQVPMPWCAGDAGRVDGVIDVWRLIIEADGRRWHARLAAMDEDRRRDQEAARHGYRTLRFGWSELRDDPARVRAVVVDAGAHRLRAAS